MMGTCALSPMLIMKLACMELVGPIMACTSSSFIKSKAENRRNFNQSNLSRYMVM